MSDRSGARSLVAIRKAAGLLAGGQPNELPETFWYSVKRRLLGPPMVNEQLRTERLSKVLGLGVLSCDGISSANYGSELILHELLPFFGLTAFTLLLPMTGVILLGIALVVLSYREVVSVYTRAGGSYVVARENFGPRVAQVAAVALMVDYIVTVAVQTAAGSQAILSTFPVLGDASRRDDDPAGHRGRRDPAHVLRQPARRQGERQDVRAADLPVLRIGRPDDRGRPGPRGVRRRAAARHLGIRDHRAAASPERHPSPSAPYTSSPGRSRTAAPR